MRRRTTLPDRAVESPGKASSLERGLDVLRCFDAAEPMLSAAQIAERLRMPRGSALRLLATLCDAQYLAHLPEPDLYRVHSEAILLGQAFLSGSQLVRRARPVLQGFVDQHRCHAVLCVARPEGLIALLYVHGSSARAKPGLGTGTIFSPEHSAVGHAWLWTEGPHAQAECIARLRAADTTGRAGGAAELYRAFHELERTGVCTLPDARRGTVMSATPIDAGNAAKAILGSILDLDDPLAESDAYVQSLRKAAERITDVILGHRRAASW
ncbi:IclR family transcriptional regulator [Ramlibacter sp.]|uniref:IclR family transcriptional regulator n=1 Tax=Ramlibacter sp. TaxID=1917967 RepID=UPI003D0A9861